MTKLSVNVNKVALLRNQRDLTFPSVVGMGRIALEAGAFGVTVHPRPDQRHIRRDDVPAVAALLAEERWADREFNIEGNPLIEGHLMPLMRAHRPTQATLVPDSVDQNTSDHGFALDDPAVIAALKPIVAELKDLGCRVSLFVDPEPEVARRAVETGADRVELYTESWARAFGTDQERALLDAYAATSEAVVAEGLGVNAGHDLNLHNLGRFLSEVPHVAEVSIGHALVADALTMGMAAAVRAYLDVIASV